MIESYYSRHKEEQLIKKKKYREEHRQECHQREIAWAKKNKDKCKVYMRRSNLKKRYGITLNQYEILWKRQNGLCVICDGPLPLHRAANIDHDHSTGIVRGLLCIHCNQGLGHFLDDPELLRRAITYVMGDSPCIKGGP